MLRGGRPERRGDRDERYADAGGVECSQPGAHRAHYPLHLFRRGHLLLARNVIRSERFWPVLSLCYKGLRFLLTAKFRDYCQEHVEHFTEFVGAPARNKLGTLFSSAAAPRSTSSCSTGLP